MLSELFWNNKWRIILTYSLLFVEFIVFALLPYLMGLAVDGILAGNHEQFNFWIGVSLFALVTGFIRRRYDSRAFLSIWSAKATQVINDLIAKDVDRTKIVSRSYMVKEIANFLEFTIPSTVSAIVDIAVSLVILWLFLPLVGIWMVGLLLAAVVSCYIFAIYINRMEIACQHGREKIADSIMKDDKEGVAQGYDDQRKMYVKYSDLDATSWGILDIIAGIAQVVVVMSVANAGATAGAIMANLLYCQKLFEKSCFITFFFRHYQQINTCTEFLNSEEGAQLKK